MTDFDVLYRGVPVPDSVLTPGLFSGALEGFKLGVDATHQMFGGLNNPDTPEPKDDQYDYFSDGDSSGNEWIWRYRKGVNHGEFAKEYDPVWTPSSNLRGDIEDCGCTYLREQDLPGWARD